MNDQDNRTETIVQFKRLLKNQLATQPLKGHELAGQLRETTNCLYKWLNEHTENRFPADRLADYTVTVGPEILRTIAFQSGYAIAPLPEASPYWQDALQAAVDIMRHAAEVIALLAKATGNGSLTQYDFLQLKEAVQAAISALLTVQIQSVYHVRVIPRPSALT
jgi:hypothetical protein